MKKTFSLLTLALLFVALLTGCRNDDEDRKNFLKIGSTEYKITDGVLENYGISLNSDGYNMDLTFLTEGTALSVNGSDVTISGNGHAVYFEAFTSTATHLDNGDYTYSTTKPYPIKSFDYGGVFDVNNGTASNFVQVKGGKLSVNRNGDNYVITFNTTDESGNPVTGRYQGTLKYSNKD